MSSRTKKSSKNLITTFLQQFLNAALGVAVRTVFIYVLGKEYLGLNGLFTNVLSMLSLTDLGFGVAINYKLYKPLAEHDDHTIRIYLKFYKYIYRIVSCVIFVLGVLLIPVLPTLIKDYDRFDALGINAVLIYLLYLMRSVSSYLFFAYKSAIVKADQKSYLLNTANIVVDIVSSIAQIVVLIILHNYIIYLIVLLGFSILQNFIFAQIATKRYPTYFIKESDSLSKKEIIELFKDCSALLVFKADNVILKASDNLILSAFQGITLVGLYSNYMMFYTIIKGILSKMYDSVKASMGNFFAVENIERKYTFFKTTNLITFILFGTAAGGIAIVSNELIVCWLGTDYLIQQPLAVLMGIELLFSGIKKNLNQIRTISGIIQQMWYRPIIGIFINLIVSFIGVQIWGINGVVLGTIMAYVFSNFAVDPLVIYRYTFTDYKSVSEYYRRNFGYMAVLTVTCIAARWLCSIIVVGYAWFSVIVHSLICAVMIPAAFVLVYFKTEECQYLIKKVYMIKSKWGK